MESSSTAFIHINIVWFEESHLVVAQIILDCKTADTRSACGQILADAEIGCCQGSILETDAEENLPVDETLIVALTGIVTSSFSGIGNHFKESICNLLSPLLGI